MLHNIYHCNPLNEEDSFRLVSLAPGERTDPLSAELYVVRASDNPEYQAVSYVWGDPAPVDVISCNGRNLAITANLRDALQRIRSRTEPLTLWIDAISIEQTNPDERTHQVTIMGNIYRQASMVLVCLGYTEEGDPKLVKENILVFNDIFHEQLSRGWTLADISLDPPRADIEKELSRLNVSAWKRFWKLPYWDRAWTLQEAGLATTARILYGDDEIEWEDLMLSCAWLSFCGYLRSIPSGSSVRSAWAGYDRHNRTRFSTTYRNLPSEIVFLKCLDSARRKRKAIDPRDMVYAFLAHPAAHVFTPNYRHETGQTYCNFAASCLQAHQNPNVLSYAARSGELGELDIVPSWSPVWNDTGELPYPLLTLNRSIAYNCSGNTPFEHKVSDCNLMINGVIFDSIHFITAPIRGHHIRDDGGKIESEPNPLGLAFQNSVVDSSRCGKIYPDLLKSFAGALTASRSHIVAGSPNPSSSPSPADLVRWIRSFEAGYNASLNRCFFITKQGYIGIGPPLVQVSDICCMLIGAKTPFIIRLKGESTYQLVGECYIECVMDGEVMEKVKNGEIQQERIVLI